MISDRKRLMLLKQQQRKKPQLAGQKQAAIPATCATCAKPKEFTSNKTGGTFYFYRKGPTTVGVHISGGRTNDKRKANRFKNATTEELIENAYYDTNAAPITLTKKEFEKLSKFLPNPLPSNIIIELEIES